MLYKFNILALLTMDIYFFPHLVSHLSRVTQFLLFNFLWSLSYIKLSELDFQNYDPSQAFKRVSLSFLSTCLIFLPFPLSPLNITTYCVSFNWVIFGLTALWEVLLIYMAPEAKRSELTRPRSQPVRWAVFRRGQSDPKLCTPNPSFPSGGIAHPLSRRGLFPLPICVLLRGQFFSSHSYFFSLDVESYRFFMGHKYFLRRQIIDLANAR